MRSVKDVSSQAKAIRASVIKEYMQLHGYKQCVCFSCGNASRKLKDAGVDCIDISPSGDLNANRWWSMAEIRKAFPTCFDATSGHLSTDVMRMIVECFRAEFEDRFKPHKKYIIPAGSGETILCLKLAFPCTEFVAMYDDSNPATQYNRAAPLSCYVAAFFPVIKVTKKVWKQKS